MTTPFMRSCYSPCVNASEIWSPSAYSS